MTSTGAIERNTPYSPPPAPETRESGALPPPAPVPLDASALALLDGVETSDVSSRLATRRLKTAQTNKKQAILAARRAIERAQKKEEKAGFWGDVARYAKVAGAVAAVAGGVAAAGVSGGSSLVMAAAIAGAVLSASSVVMQETNLDTNVDIAGVKVPASTLVAVGGAALSAGGAVGAACSGAEVASQGGSAALEVTASAAQVTGAAATGTVGLSTIEGGRYTAAATELRAGARQQDLLAAADEREAERAVEMLRSAAQARSRALRAISVFVTTKEQSKRIAMGVKA